MEPEAATNPTSDSVDASSEADAGAQAQARAQTHAQAQAQAPHSALLNTVTKALLPTTAAKTGVNHMLFLPAISNSPYMCF